VDAGGRDHRRRLTGTLLHLSQGPQGCPHGAWPVGCRKSAAPAQAAVAAREQFKTAMKNIGKDVAYLDQPEFAKFWDADAKRVEDAVHLIGRVQG
jgi:hypothetical protein